MAEFKLGRIRFVWKNTWVASGTTYIKDDVVRFGGSSWVCVRGHTSSAFATNQTGGSGDIITTDALAAGLQLHLGANAEIYNTEQGMQLYQTYISKRFTPSYIPVNAMKNIIDDSASLFINYKTA
jgi:hypothetical protein